MNEYMKVTRHARANTHTHARAHARAHAHTRVPNRFVGLFEIAHPAGIGGLVGL